MTKSKKIAIFIITILYSVLLTIDIIYSSIKLDCFNGLALLTIPVISVISLFFINNTKTFNIIHLATIGDIFVSTYIINIINNLDVWRDDIMSYIMIPLIFSICLCINSIISLLIANIRLEKKEAK